MHGSDHNLTLAAIRDTLANFKPDRSPESGRPAAVLVPLFEREGKTVVLLTKRTKDLPSHAGQISFPGGKRDPGDADPRATALREAFEEVGIPASAVNIIGELDDCPTFVSNFVITPIVGVIPDRFPFVSNPREIASLIEAPLADFLLPGALRTRARKHGDDMVIIPYYSVAGEIVWGATARILTQLFSILGFNPELDAIQDDAGSGREFF